MFRAITNVFRVAELRARLAYTLALLAVYRLGVFINTPGVDRVAMNAYMQEQKARGGLVNLFNLFSGGALDQMSIFGLGIMPYVSASIIMQLLTVVVPTLERLQKEGAAGQGDLRPEPSRAAGMTTIPASPPCLDPGMPGSPRQALPKQHSNGRAE